MKHVVIVGAGGNIGSHLVPHIARMSAVGAITLVDPDRYEPKNLTSQDITRADVGRPKVSVQRTRIRRRANRAMHVTAICDRVEHVAWGRLHADVILACLDSRAARQHVNEVAWTLGVPWIDAGVAPAALLSRVNVYVPSHDAACLECAWDDRDYAALEQIYPCDAAAGIVPTNAPSSLGALAAARQAIECQKLLDGDLERALVGRQALLDAGFHRHYVSAFGRNPLCRLTSHRPVPLTWLRERPAELTLRQLFDRAVCDGAGDGPMALAINGCSFLLQLTCSSAACGGFRSLNRFAASPRTRDVVRSCRACGAPLTLRLFDRVDRLSAARAADGLLERTLHQLGARPRDLCRVEGGDGDRHYVLGGDAK